MVSTHQHRRARKLCLRRAPMCPTSFAAKKKKQKQDEDEKTIGESSPGFRPTHKSQMHSRPTDRPTDAFRRSNPRIKKRRKRWRWETHKFRRLFLMIEPILRSKPTPIFRCWLRDLHLRGGQSFRHSEREERRERERGRERREKEGERVCVCLEKPLKPINM